MATWGRIPMNCRACHEPGGEELRREWGCDAPIEGESLFSVECWLCGGGDRECQLCGGEGEVPMDRCPHAIVDHESYEICTFAALLEVGILPSSGGLLDQSSSFSEAVMFVANLKSKLEQSQYEVDGD